MRIPIVRLDDCDDHVDDGTAEWDGDQVSDFRDLEGRELNLPPGWKFHFAVTDLPGLMLRCVECDVVYEPADLAEHDRHDGHTLELMVEA